MRGTLPWNTGCHRTQMVMVERIAIHKVHPLPFPGRPNFQSTSSKLSPRLGDVSLSSGDSAHNGGAVTRYHRSTGSAAYSGRATRSFVGRLLKATRADPALRLVIHNIPRGQIVEEVARLAAGLLHTSQPLKTSRSG